ncbi:MAG TPA: PilN domain-containing protein [Candidatus Saccharimonadales bacterium]|nr:PilN domain-containing protein [Candidatus Saccharimonadales bacterium]
MINLLPPTVKAETSYAKRNRTVVRYVWLLSLVILIVGAEFAGAEVYISHQKQSYEKDIAAKQSQINGYKDLESQAQAANSRLKAFKTLVGDQARFSSLLADLAAHTPRGVFINSISLTGDSKQAVKIAATANSYSSAVSFRDALVTSSRIKDASIDDISNPADGVYKVNVTVAFKPGASR